MAEFKVPELGESVAGGDVTRVLVKVGDVVARDQSVLELETDKATIEVPSSVAGRVTEVKVKQGDKIKVGAVVFVVDDADAPQAAAPADVAAKAAPAPSPRRAARPRATRQGCVDACASGTGAVETGQGGGRSPEAEPCASGPRRRRPQASGGWRVKWVSTSTRFRVAAPRAVSRTRTSRSTRAAS